MLKISHISKTFNPGTVNEKKAIEDLSLELKKGALQMQALSSWTAGISHLCRSTHVQKKSAVFIRTRCAELLRV